MRYLTLAEALVIAETVTGIETKTLAHVSRLDLVDSALHAPAGIGEEDFYPEFEVKAAVLVVRLARNHPLPEWQQASRVAVAHPVLRAQWQRPQIGPMGGPPHRG